MTAIPRTMPAADESANDRLKKQAGSWLWSSVMLATLAHFGAFALWPRMSVQVVVDLEDALEVIDVPPEVTIPEAPKPLDRPVRPVVATVDVAEHVTIPPTDWASYSVDELPPPPAIDTEVPEKPPFTPFDVDPRVLNVDEILRALEREYPPSLREAGIGGTVSVLFHVDERGLVQATRVGRSSGYPALDSAALAVSTVYRFSPAQNRDRTVAVWVSIPITFEVR